MRNKKLNDLAKTIRELKSELYKEISNEASNNLLNNRERDLVSIEKRHREIVELEEKYTFLGGVFSDCYISVDSDFFSKKSVSSAAILSLIDSGKIAVDKKQIGGAWLIIPMDKNKDKNIVKIKSIIGDDVSINKKRIPMQDMLIDRGAKNDFDI